MCKDKSITSVSSGIVNENDNSKKTTQSRKVIRDAARRAEHRCLTALSTHAGNTTSLEITRPSVTNCPDGGHDLGLTGSTEEVKAVISTLTGRSIEDLSFLDESAKKGKLKARIDVKNGKTIAGDNIDKHAADSSRSPDCQIHLVMLTNPNVKITPDAQKKLMNQRDLFRENGTLVDITSIEGLQKIEANNKAIASKNESNE